MVRTADVNSANTNLELESYDKHGDLTFLTTISRVS